MHAAYLEAAFNPDKLSHKVHAIANILRSINPDKIAVRGMSGAIVGGALSLATGIPLVVVRKDDNSHSCHEVEFTGETIGDYVIIDDLISTGKTVDKIMCGCDNFDGKCIGIILYDNEYYLTSYADVKVYYAR